LKTSPSVHGIVVLKVVKDEISLEVEGEEYVIV
jgi:hypothetical protein